MNLFQFDNLYRSRVSAQGLTGSIVNIDLDPVESGKIRVITHVAIENQTKSYTKCRLQIYDGFIPFPIDQALNPAKDELIIHKQDILLGERDILRAVLTGTTTGDNLVMVAIGWERKRKD